MKEPLRVGEANTWIQYLKFPAIFARIIVIILLAAISLLKGEQLEFGQRAPQLGYPARSSSEDSLEAHNTKCGGGGVAVKNREKGYGREHPKMQLLGVATCPEMTQSVHLHNSTSQA